jgi:hypothetical protein
MNDAATPSYYVKSQADSEAHAEVVGMVTVVPTLDSFTFSTNGKVTGLSGLTPGIVYYLSETTAGAMTATEPDTYGEISKPVFIADTATSGFIMEMRGVVISAWESEDRYSIGTAAGRPSAPMTGKMYYETDLDQLSLYDATWREITLGQWVSYTPVVAQPSTGIAATINYARYMKIGRLVKVQANISVTGAGTSGQAISMSLPITGVTPSLNGNTIGTMEVYDLSSGVVYGGFAVQNTTTTVVARHYSASGAGNSIGTGTASFALANGDQIFTNIEYEAAA